MKRFTNQLEKAGVNVCVDASPSQNCTLYLGFAVSCMENNLKKTCQSILNIRTHFKNEIFRKFVRHREHEIDSIDNEASSI